MKKLSRDVRASIDDDMDLDTWLRETDSQTLEEPTIDEDTLSPERQQKGQEKKQKPTEVVGVWEKGHSKPTSANPGDAAADALKKFLKSGRK